MYLVRTFALVLGVLVAVTATGRPQVSTYEETVTLLRSLNHRKDDRSVLATLFKLGDARIDDLTKVLNDPDRQVSLRAQIVIRYLGNPTGMKALEEWYDTQSETVRSGPIPLPLSEREFKWISSRPLREMESGEVYALALDRSPKAQAILKRMIDASENDGTQWVATEALRRIKIPPKQPMFSARGDLAGLVLKNAFFVDKPSRRYSSARLIGFNGKRDKALIEVHVKRGPLSEEWYHVVLSGSGSAWKFFSITLVSES